MTVNRDGNYPKAHSSFKKEFKSLRRSINGTNRYTMDKIVGKLDIFEAEGEEDDDKDRHAGGKMNKYSVRRIVGSNGLTRLKENKSSYAIGDKDGNPITGFDFIYVPYHTEGTTDGFVEVITKGGDTKRFNVDSHEITECMGVGTIGAVGAVGDAAATSATTDSSGAESSSDMNHDQSINYKDVEKELLTPTKERMCFLAGGYPFSRTFHKHFKKHSKLI